MRSNPNYLFKVFLFICSLQQVFSDKYDHNLNGFNRFVVLLTENNADYHIIGNDIFALTSQKRCIVVRIQYGRAHGKTCQQLFLVAVVKRVALLIKISCSAIKCLL